MLMSRQKTLVEIIPAFGVIRISDLRSLGSWCIKGTDESTLVTDSSVPLMNYDPSDLGSLILIQINPKECTHYFDVCIKVKLEFYTFWNKS